MIPDLPYDLNFKFNNSYSFDDSEGSSDQSDSLEESDNSGTIGFQPPSEEIMVVEILENEKTG